MARKGSIFSALRFWASHTPGTRQSTAYRPGMHDCSPQKSGAIGGLFSLFWKMFHGCGGDPGDSSYRSVSVYMWTQEGILTVVYSRSIERVFLCAG